MPIPSVIVPLLKMRLVINRSSIPSAVGSLNEDQQIDRKRLSSIVFNNPDALGYLESIVHPLVFQAVDIIIRRASQPVIVIEAIKLLESGLAKNCDCIWVVTSDRKVQVIRLVNQRKLSAADANLRIDAQPSQKDKDR